ncbi:nitrilotriacetate monooxygenase [Gordonia paraffinivorans]|uniref:NtaA/DmoA family FMN-dependent monooxygenase n=1 Tax=Gordonia paraffinivorans TaxID=175628 RepID=UPI000D6069D4|nr:NtaA/DmoA family FMN-dependent monooxygenase [Gordonia paraffinivorans]MBY4574105.1 nitrilotriacetate monooxygenase [Gordonia paraffinivorans]PWD42469.1 nitrilotriacetate monooxygenase [Gordonia paraffinivorans]
MTERRSGHVILGINALVLGYLPASWQSPELTPGSFVDPAYWENIGRTAERGTLDAVFLADIPALGDPAHDANPAHMEPTVNWSYVAGVTDRLGVVATASTTFNDPFDLAERWLSFDHVTRGRAAWNIVTSRGAAPARNFGFGDVPPRDDRYDRAAEFVDVVRALWDSAVTGERVHHRGEYFEIDGRLSVPPFADSAPVLFQAGGSAKGRELAARVADGVFAAELTRDQAVEHYRQVKRRAVEHGRSPDSVKIVPGLLTTIGSTEEEARRRNDDLHDRGPASYSIEWLSQSMGIDAGKLDLDAPFPEEVLAAPDDLQTFTGSVGFRESIVAQIRRTNPTVREYLKQTRYTGSGHAGFVGTPEQLADRIEDWFHAGAVDGFNLQPDVLVDGLQVIVDEVVPILRKRGLYRHEYETDTLRGHFEAAATSAPLW